MTSGLKTIIYPVRDLSASKQLYQILLGVQPYVDQPYYVAFEAAGQDVGLDPNAAAKGITVPVAYWHTDDVAAAIAALVAAGATPHTEPSDVGGGNLVATVRDADGNVIGLIQQA